ncbi:hypothetical protein [Parvibaculum sp.]|jgi:hypothetical protein|uniref:hypothetical protein n=1 Tax=Parvibaculum sp. TaxID=2024848 RepID=UPI000C6005B8|nr:hypothetical protein [Parvibaculum sp.]HAC56784.1 hypothetical protein [Rhodobiaceae bacterium]MAU62129.1 hypothetical protein [Parvibaculum sp.]MBO6667021.1 hypothetical protein [Parvibaculum sp.]MBO6690465.1 hypothetical protein [Parvibaculum sp.]MBO6713642.1 hypothetical protein [Parvibaculum sp.]|tara:strand:- start:2504 stop:2854 length:351 start_codon:yes stop_codon:yes gene_type:complete
MIRLANPIACLAGASLLLAATGAAAISPKYHAGTRSGPFVATEKSLGDLLGDGYEIRGNLGTALILQKKASVYSCQIPPNPEKLDFEPYFVCSELRELARDAAETEEPAEAPQTGN